MPSAKIKSDQWRKSQGEPCPGCDKVRRWCRHCEMCPDCCRCRTCVCGEIDCEVHELCYGWPAKGCLGHIDHDDGHYIPNPAGGVDMMYCDKCAKRLGL